MELELVLVDAAGGRSAVSVTAAPGDAAGAVRTALAGLAGLAPTAGPLHVDGRVVADRTPVAAAGLVSGAVVSLGRPLRDRTAIASEGLELAVVGGLAAGDTAGLRLGRTVTIGRDPRCDLTLDDDEVSRAHATVTADDPRQSGVDGARLVDTGSRNGVRWRGYRLDGTGALAPGDAVGVGETVLELRRPAPAAPIVDDAVVNRPPRIVVPTAVPEVAVPAEPDRPRAFRLPLAGVLAPLALAGILFATMDGNRIFLVFLALSPVLVLANVIGDRRSGRKDYLVKKKEYDAEVAALDTRLAALAVAEERTVRAALPDPAALLRIALAPDRPAVGAPARRTRTSCGCGSASSTGRCGCSCAGGRPSTRRRPCTWCRSPSTSPTPGCSASPARAPRCCRSPARCSPSSAPCTPRTSSGWCCSPGGTRRRTGSGRAGCRTPARPPPTRSAPGWSAPTTSRPRPGSPSCAGWSRSGTRSGAARCATASRPGGGSCSSWTAPAGCASCAGWPTCCATARRSASTRSAWTRTRRACRTSAGRPRWPGCGPGPGGGSGCPAGSRWPTCSSTGWRRRRPTGSGARWRRCGCWAPRPPAAGCRTRSATWTCSGWPRARHRPRPTSGRGGRRAREPGRPRRCSASARTGRSPSTCAATARTRWSPAPAAPASRSCCRRWSARSRSATRRTR